MRRLSGLCLTLALLGTSELSAQAEYEAWKNKWFWGAQGGVFVFSTPSENTQAAFQAGGHWLITRDRIAMHLAVDQIFFDAATSAIADPTNPGGVRTVSFSNGRRWQAELYAIPTNTNPQVFAGGGFAIHQITDAVAEGTFATPQQLTSVTQLLDQVATKAFLVFTGGVQFHTGRWAVYAKYQFAPEARDFLITSEQHAITGGLRFALSRSGQDISTR